MSDKVDFLHTDKHETFLAVDFNTFPIKVSYKVITSEKHQSFYKLALSFLMEVGTHVQSTQHKKVVMFLQ